MLIGPYYKCNYVFDMILCAIMCKYVVLNFYLFTVRKSVWLSILEFKLKALSAIETEIDYAIVISVIFRAYSEI